MPVNCPINELTYNACVTCRNLHNGKCFYDSLASRLIGDILTDRERIAIIEDKLATTPSPAANNTMYSQLLKRVLLLEEKLNAHLDKTAKPKSKYA